MFELVEADLLQLVNTSVLYLVGNLRHFSSYSVWPTPWLMQFPRLPFADDQVELLNYYHHLQVVDHYLAGIVEP